MRTVIGFGLSFLLLELVPPEVVPLPLGGRLLLEGGVDILG